MLPSEYTPFFTWGFFKIFMYFIQYCFICRPSVLLCRRRLGSRTIATSYALTTHLISTRSHPLILLNYYKSIKMHRDFLNRLSLKLSSKWKSVVSCTYLWSKKNLRTNVHSAWKHICSKDRPSDSSAVHMNFVEGTSISYMYCMYTVLRVAIGNILKNGEKLPGIGGVPFSL